MNKGEVYKWPHEPESIFEIIEDKGNSVEYEYIEGHQKGAKFTSTKYGLNSCIKLTKGTGTSAIIPTHYNDSKIDALAVIDDWNLDFRLGNTIKYIQRHTKKGTPLQDLKKAAQYLALKIKQMEDEG